ncbi:hypothetical protein [Mycolicibacterium sp.]|uniref:hypothetical protein n=1 Tax=Mycolicibacterium sp. TaxID=2320850 RepID=UPI0037CB12E3
MEHNQTAIVTIEPAFVDKPTACQMLGNISIDKLDQLIRCGEIIAQRLGKRVVITPAEVRWFAAACPSWEPYA